MFWFKQKRTSVSGISTSDWMSIYNKILREYNAEKEKHKKPTEYMRGLMFGLEALDAIRPYDISSTEVAE